MKLLNANHVIRLVIEFDTADELRTVLEFVGDALDNGVLQATFRWTAEDVTYFTQEENDDDSDDDIG